MPYLKIYFRYLFARLFVPFAVCVCGFALLRIMVDVYGNLDDFLEHKGSFGTTLWIILRYYSDLVPSLIVQVLPAAILFSTLWTLLALNRRSELVAFQAGGMAPPQLFSPFLVFCAIWMVVLAVDLNWPAPESLVTCDRLLKQVKGEGGKSNILNNLPFDDRRNRRTWYFQTLDLNQNTAKGMTVLDRDSQGNDQRQYFAGSGEYTPGGFWRLSNVVVITYSPSGSVEQTQTLQQKDAMDLTTPPKQISLVVSPPDHLTVSQLSQYIDTSTSSQENLAQFRTEWWYRMLFPLSLLSLMFFGLLQGARIDRRDAAAGVFKTILLLVLYVVVSNVVLQMGNHSKLPPFIAAIATPFVFGVVGLALLASKYGWSWQLVALVQQWREKLATRMQKAPEGGGLSE